MSSDAYNYQRFGWDFELAVELSQFGRVFCPDYLAPGLEAFLTGSPIDYTSE